MVVITNKSSNILEDLVRCTLAYVSRLQCVCLVDGLIHSSLVCCCFFRCSQDALHLLAKIVGDYCSRLDERDVTAAAFDLIFAFDECFALGYKEKLTMRQIEENLEMDSHNERIHEIMQQVCM